MYTYIYINTQHIFSKIYIIGLINPNKTNKNINSILFFSNKLAKNHSFKVTKYREHCIGVIYFVDGVHLERQICATLLSY